MKGTFVGKIGGLEVLVDWEYQANSGEGIGEDFEVFDIWLASGGKPLLGADGEKIDLSLFLDQMGVLDEFTLAVAKALEEDHDD